MAISAMALFMAVVSAVFGQEYEKLSDLERSLLCCSEIGDPPLEEVLAHHAKEHGLAKEDLAAELAEIARNGIESDSDDFKLRLAENAIWGLAAFGGENEYAFVHDTMQKQGENFRRVAMNVLFHMAPEKWEDLVREIVSDEMYGDLDRYLACREAFQVGMGGDLDTRNRVIEVFQELSAGDTLKTSRNRFGLWLTELKGEGWEEWLKKVTTEDGFTYADRLGAYDLAFRTGRDGDETTHQHVLDVLKEMRDKEVVQGVKNILCYLIGELENR
jgi:hypothetical protein